MDYLSQRVGGWRCQRIGIALKVLLFLTTLSLPASADIRQYVDSAPGLFERLRCRFIVRKFTEVKAEPKVVVADWLQSNQFKTDRNLYSYRHLLGGYFDGRLMTFTPGSHWIDMGAGDAHALLDAMTHESLPRIQATAIGVKRPNKIPWKYFERFESEGRFQYIEGMINNELLSRVAKANLITDVFGPLAYSKNPDEIMELYLKQLHDGGEIFAFGSSLKTRIVTPKGTMNFYDWLKTLPGVLVDLGTHGENWVRVRLDPQFQKSLSTLRDGADTRIIPRLELVDYFDGAPPIREYRLVLN